jgi:hypothetical protein
MVFYILLTFLLVRKSNKRVNSASKHVKTCKKGGFNKRDLLGRDGAPRDIPNRSLDPVPFYGIPWDGIKAVPAVPWDPLDTLFLYYLEFMDGRSGQGYTRYIVHQGDPQILP